MKGKKAILFSGSHLLGKGVAEEACGYILRRREMGAAFTGGMKPEAYFIFSWIFVINKITQRNDDISEVMSPLRIQKVLSWSSFISKQSVLCLDTSVYTKRKGKWNFFWCLPFCLWFLKLFPDLFAITSVCFGVDRPHLNLHVNERWPRLYSFKKNSQRVKKWPEILCMITFAQLQVLGRRQ